MTNPSFGEQSVAIQSLYDSRNLEVHLEDLCEQLRLLRLRKPTDPFALRQHAEHVLAISHEIRQTSALVRRYSATVRSRLQSQAA